MAVVIAIAAVALSVTLGSHADTGRVRPIKASRICRPDWNGRGVPPAPPAEPIQTSSC